MAISNYPRPGYPIVPSMLREFLPTELRSLDESAYKNSSNQKLMEIGEQIIAALRSELATIRERAGNRRLPTPPRGLRLADLELETRTFNRLMELGVQCDLQLIGLLTVNKLLAMRNFGVKSLVDLLTTLDLVCSQTWSDQPLEPVPQFGDAESRDVINREDIKTIRECCVLRFNVPAEIRLRRLPKLQDNLKVENLELRNRTYNCLEKAGFIDHPEALSDQSVADLLLLPSFGKETLADLVAVLEPFFRFAEDDEGQSTATANEIAIQATLLVELAESDLILNDDPRLGSLLRTISTQAENAQEAGKALLNGSTVPTNPAKLLPKIQQFREQIESLSELKIEEELASFMTGVRNRRNAEIFTRRFGLDGLKKETLQELGDRYVMTRERVRQICDKVGRFFTGRQPFAPTLDRGLCLVASRLPGIASEIEAQLVREGIAHKAFRLESLQSAARLLQREPTFSIADTGGVRTAVEVGAHDSATKVLRLAHKAIRHWGALTTEELSARVAEKYALPADLATRIITKQNAFRWLDQESGWFWLNTHLRNRVTNRIQKILSICERIDIGELRDGVRRNHRMGGIAPPRRVILEMCRQLPWCDVEGSFIRANVDFKWEEVLSDVEVVFAEVLEANGPAMQRERLEELCLSRGMSRSTFYVYIDYSPIMTKHARGVYGLRGIEVPPGLVESLKPSIQRGRVRKDSGWLEDGKVWVGYQLSESTVYGGVVTIPSKMTTFINGQFSLRAADGSVMGTLASNNTSAWGLGPMFRRRGVEAEDYLVLVFDLANRTAVAHIGNQGVLEEFQTGGGETRLATDETDELHSNERFAT